MTNFHLQKNKLVVMKKLIVLTSLIMACSATTLLAQPPAGGGGGGRMDPAQQKEQLKTQLGLTEVQADSVMAINAAMRPLMMDLRNASDAERPAKMKEIMEARNKRLEAALPADVAKKVEDMMAKRMQRMGQGGGRPSGGN